MRRGSARAPCQPTFQRPLFSSGSPSRLSGSRLSPVFRRTLAGNFALVFSTAGFAYAAAWPLETLKNLAQAGLPTPGATLADRLRYLGGPGGLYRGALPGVLGGGFRNGCAAVAMNGLANPLLTRLGLRDPS